MTYNAVVCKIHTRPHPNADNIQLGVCRGNQVVIGKDVKDGELGVFFVTDGQLSSQFAEIHDLISRTDADGKKAGGFFAQNRRVRAQKFRGEKSDGYWVPLSYFDYTGVRQSGLDEGYEFSELNNHPICNKYVTEATRRAIFNQKAQPRKANVMFAKHFETEKWRDRSDKILPDSLIIITEKQHGSSHRLARVLQPRNSTGLRKVVESVFGLVGFVPQPRWVIMHGSRNVVLNSDLDDLYYGTDFRAGSTKFLEEHLRKGEVIYGEIVGYSNVSSPIMGVQDTTGLKDKEVTKKYGPKMVYAYGQADGTCKFYVYRITQVNDDGFAIDLSWAQVKERCAEIGVEHVREVWPPFIYDDDILSLTKKIEYLVEGQSVFDPSHIREGVCIRVEHANEHFTLKHKSWLFGALEGYLKDKDEVVDAEEAA